MIARKKFVDVDSCFYEEVRDIDVDDHSFLVTSDDDDIVEDTEIEDFEE